MALLIKGPNLSRRNFLKGALTVTLASTALSAVGFRAARALPPPKEKLYSGKKIPSVCPYCAVGCTVIGTVIEDEVFGRRVVDVGPDLEAPHTEGTLCSKGQASMQLLPQFNAYRLRRPLIRQNSNKGEDVDPQWKESTWEEAFDLIISKYREVYNEWASKKSWLDAKGNYWIPGGRDFVSDPKGAMKLHPRALPIALISGDYLSNEEGYIGRKLGMLMGSNNTDLQARRCHSTTVAGLADVFGFGGMTNSAPDFANAKVVLNIGSNHAEQHPVAFRFTSKALEKGAKLLVFDPRYGRTASKANMFAWFRPGTEAGIIHGLQNYAIQNNLIDRQFLTERTDAFRDLSDAELESLLKLESSRSNPRVKTIDELKAELDKTGFGRTVFGAFAFVASKFTPQEVARITGVPADKFLRMAAEFTNPRNRPGTIIWCIGCTQHSCGTQIIRSLGHLQTMLGNMGRPGGGGNVLRGITNVQGNNDMNHKQDIWLGYRRVPGAQGERLVLSGGVEADVRRYQKYKNLISQGVVAAEIQKQLGIAWVGDLRHYATWREGETNWGIFIGTVPEDDPDKGTVISDVPGEPGLTTIEFFRLMEQGVIKFMLIDAMNPVVSVGNANQVIRGLSAAGTFTVVMDLFLSETAHFADIVLPGASRYEGSGSVTNTSRWIQWRHRMQQNEEVVDPFDTQGRKLTEIKASLWLKDQLFKRLRAAGLLKLPSERFSEEKGVPLADLRKLSKGKNVSDTWNYSNPASTEDPDPFQVSKEVNATVRLYRGMVGAKGENRMAQRSKIALDERDRVLGLWKGWAWSWPDNQRILYDLSEAPDPRGLRALGREFFKPPNAPLDQKLQLSPEKAGRQRATFWSGLYAGRGIPVPDYFEPVETPDRELAQQYPPLVGDHPYGVKGVSFHPGNTSANGLIVGTVEEGFDVVMTTFRLTEHMHTGQITRNVPWLAEMMPEHYVEISPTLAEKIEVKTGERVKITSKRETKGIITKAIVTKRMSRLLINNRYFEIAALPWAYGFAGPVTGPISNKVMIDAMDDETGMPETKIALVKIEKV